jgi:hypothetical protein
MRNLFWQWYESDTPSRYRARVFRRNIRNGEVKDSEVDEIGDCLAISSLTMLVKTFHPTAKCINQER